MSSETQGHILIFSAFYPPHMGGVERYTNALSRSLSRSGYRVTVVTSSSSFTPNHQSLGDDLVSIVEIPSLTVMGDRFPLIMPNGAFFRALRRIFEYSYQAVIIQTRYYPISLLGCYIAKHFGLSPLVIDHSSGPLSSERTIVGSIIRTYERFITRLICRYNPRFASVSIRGSEWLKSLGIHVVGIAPNSIDAEQFANCSSGRDWRGELGCSNELLVTFAGRLIEEKGVLKLIDAARLMQNFPTRLRFVFAGDGSLASKLRDTHVPNISFVGALTQPDLSALLKQTDIFCLPSDYPEGLPTVLLEASAQHCAIIVSNTGGSQEIVPDKHHGIVLSDTRPETICRAISILATDSNRLAQYMDTASNNVRTNFSWSSTANTVIRLARLAE